MLKLDQIKTQKIKEDQTSGTFVIEPLDPGYGHTIGNSLRRVLLSSLPGAAITQIQIEGVKHQFSTLPGMVEDIIEFILNVRNIRLKIALDKPVKLILSERGPKEVKAKDIKVPAGVEIVNPNLTLAHLSDHKAKLSATMTAEVREGYVFQEEHPKNEIGVIPLDAVFSPVRRVSYQIEATRVGRFTNFDKLTLEIDTDGTILPSEALSLAAKILVDRIRLIFEPVGEPKRILEEDLTKVVSDDTLSQTLEELDIPIRQVNALKKKKIVSVGDFLNAPREERLKIKNYGPKSDDQIISKLESLGIPQEALRKGV